MRRLLEIFDMIKIEHTLFALPFALVGLLFGADGWPGWRLLGLVALAMVFARSAAMAFNRWADAEIDAQNPRTRSRSIPAGRLKRGSVLVFVLINTLLFIGVCSLINPMTFVLSPVALLVVLGYSYTKRFTSLSHLVLGLGLAIAPAGGWIAARGTLDLPAVMLSLAVLFWVSGFDILYALQDQAFDRENRLHSIPVRFGTGGSLLLARASHALMIMALALFVWLTDAGAWFAAGVAVSAILLIYEHSLVRSDDLSRLDAAFFQVNSVLSINLLIFAVLQFGVLVYVRP